MSFQAVNPWGAETKRSRYPFTETSSLRDISGALLLSDATLMECQVWAAMARPSRVYVSEIVRSLVGLRISISSLDEVLGQVEVTDMTKTRAKIFNQATGQVGFLRVAPGGFARLYDNPSGTYRFAVSATELVASAIHPRPLGGVSALVAGGSAVRGDIRVVGGEGVRLREHEGKVYIDNLGDAYFSRDNCKDSQHLGLAINPVRKLVVSDPYQTIAYAPVAGQIGVRVVPAPDAPVTHRSLVSPGPNGEVLSTLLPI